MVSIIVPVYNAEKYIGRCLDSILCQTFSDIEIIVIDDGSSDKSLKICREYELKDKRIKVVAQENKGVSYTRNKGIKLAKGEFVQFVDSDDYISPDMTEKLMHYVDKYDTDMVICGCVELYDENKRFVSSEFEGVSEVKDLNITYPDIFENFILNGPVNKLYKKKCIKEGFPEDMSLGEDLIFNLKYIKNIENIYFTKENFYFYEIHEGSLNRRYRENSIEIAEKLYVNNMDFIEYAGLGDKAKTHVSNIFMRFLFYGISDLYSLSGYDKKKKKEVLNFWINNANVEKAVKVSNLCELKYKISSFLIRNKFTGIMHLLMSLKSHNA